MSLSLLNTQMTFSANKFFMYNYIFYIEAAILLADEMFKLV